MDYERIAGILMDADMSDNEVYWAAAHMADVFAEADENFDREGFMRLVPKNRYCAN